MQTLQSLPISLQTVLLLIASNVFMTFAWYGHLKNLASSPWYVAALVSWGIALFEYLLQVPANRIGHTQFNVGQLKIMQEVITLSVFVPCFIWTSRSSWTTCGQGCAWWAPCISSSAALERAGLRWVGCARLGRAVTLSRPKACIGFGPC